MSALRTLSARPELRAIAWLLLLAALTAAVATAAPAAAALLALAGAAAVVALSVSPAPARRAARPAPHSGEAGPTLRLTLPDGDTVSAREVTLAGPTEHTLLLTRDGYVVVDAQGSVVHRI